MDEPTSGLHMEDTRRLLGLIDGLVEAGNTVIVIEHNLDVMAAADWIIDMGPGAGKDGGRIVAFGTPEEVAACERSLTGACLRRPLLGASPRAGSRVRPRASSSCRSRGWRSRRSGPRRGSCRGRSRW